jgi:Holliday junction resolvase
MSERVFSYYKGRTFEYKVKRHLETMGYFVIRAARSAFPDLVAVKQGQPLLVECKLNGYIPWKEKIRLLELGTNIGAQCAIAYNDNGEVRFKMILK